MPALNIIMNLYTHQKNFSFGYMMLRIYHFFVSLFKLSTCLVRLSREAMAIFWSKTLEKSVYVISMSCLLSLMLNPTWAADSIGIWPSTAQASAAFRLSGIEKQSLTLASESLWQGDYPIDLNTQAVKSPNGHWLETEQTLRYCLDRDLPASTAEHPVLMQFTLDGAQWQDQTFHLYLEEAQTRQPLANKPLQFHLGNTQAGDEVIRVPSHIETGGQGSSRVVLSLDLGVDLPDKACLLLGQQAFESHTGQAYGTKGNFKLNIQQGASRVSIQADSYFFAEQQFQHVQTRNDYIEIKPQFQFEISHYDKARLKLGDSAPYNRHFQSLNTPATALNQFHAQYHLQIAKDIEDPLVLDSADKLQLRLHTNLSEAQAQRHIEKIWSDNQQVWQKAIGQPQWQQHSSALLWQDVSSHNLQLQYTQRLSLPAHSWYISAYLQRPSWSHAFLLYQHAGQTPLLQLETAVKGAALRANPVTNSHLRWRADTEVAQIKISAVGDHNLVLSRPNQGFFSGIDAKAFSLNNKVERWQLNSDDQALELSIQCKAPKAGTSQQAVLSLMSNDPLQPILNYTLHCYIPAPIKPPPADVGSQLLFQNSLGQLVTHIDASQWVKISAHLYPEATHQGQSAQIGLLYRYQTPAGRQQSFPIILAEAQTLSAEMSWLLYQGRLQHLPGFLSLNLYYQLADGSNYQSPEQRLQIHPNRAPNHMRLIGNQIAENSQAGAVIGYLETLDPDKEEAFRYSLLENPGEPFGYFRIDGKQLQLSNGFPPDFEQNQTLSIRVRSWDRSGAYLDQDFLIQIRNQIEAHIEATLTTTEEDWHQSDDIQLSANEEFKLSLHLQPDGAHVGKLADVLLHLSYYNQAGELHRVTERLQTASPLDADMQLQVYQGNAQGLEGYFEVQAGYQLLESNRHNLVTVMQPVLAFTVKP